MPTVFSRGPVDPGSVRPGMAGNDLRGIVLRRQGDLDLCRLRRLPSRPRIRKTAVETHAHTEAFSGLRLE